jgi:hypothetical protein
MGYKVSMLGWLNTNVSAVQAISAIVSLLLTIGLLWMTWRYVSLTARILHTAQSQLYISLQPDLVFDIIKEKSARVKYTIENKGKTAICLVRVALRPSFLVRGGDRVVLGPLVFAWDLKDLVLMPGARIPKSFDVSIFNPSVSAGYTENIYYELIVGCTDLHGLTEHTYRYQSKDGTIRYNPKLLGTAKLTWLSILCYRITNKVFVTWNRLKKKRPYI